MTFSIFNQRGENIESKLFHTEVKAQAFMDATDYVTEYGPVHVGQNCETHDEGESGNCPFCGKEGPVVRCAAFTVGAIQCSLPMYHVGSHRWLPEIPFSTQIHSKSVPPLEPSARGVERMTHQLFMHNHSYNEPHTRDWYQEHDPQSLVDSINAANAGNPRKP